jgi:hypothetical protein
MRTVSRGSRAPRPAVVAAWATRSRHGAAVYETLLYADGQLSCHGPGWFYARKGRPRGCRHTRAVEGQVADRLTGRAPTVTSGLTGRPLRRFDVS